MFGIVDGLNSRELLAFAGSGGEETRYLVHLLFRREGGDYFRIDPEDGFAAAGQGSDLAGLRDPRLVAKPLAGCKKYEKSDDGAHDIVLPNATMIIP